MLDGLAAESFSAMEKKKNKRKFTDEQIKSLELMFESETRLQPRKKMEVAKELGLHPRQVAIWFQNKRARWKSKQLERDYTILQQNHRILASKLETLIAEKQALVIQLQKLNDLLKKQKEEGECCEQVAEKGEAIKSDSEGQLQLSLPVERSEHAVGGISDDDSATKMECFGAEEELNLMSMAEPADGSLTTAQDWRGFESGGLFGQSNCGYQWWDFWS
ncbi:ARABIDOPSIS THALIANA HOMEOBOX 7, homeobox 7 [Hibiscus trionum]|uniref:Homeobox-leucine zipper protein n=1 Tax=Hibiscus trionum TaxID=183268 RepID=A0A9W7H9Y9_HIBTR|nr:ARABIDOPSIS THALIANA HOMEOBOX 7, homeobox 7 [Hibiscus trionum]